MGALFFLTLVVIVFFVALFFMVLNTILIIVWNVKKRKGKAPKKFWLVIPVIFLIVNIIVMSVPIGYVGFLRYANNTGEDTTVYAETGTVLYWPMGKYEPTTTWFEMNGKKYVEFREGFSNEKFFLHYTDERLGIPIANIKYDSSSSNPFNDFMCIVLSGSTFYDQNISTVILVENENDFEFVYVKDSPGSASLAGGTYCTEDTIASTKAYYADIANYDTQNVVCEYTVYTEYKKWGERNGNPYERVEKNITLKAGIFTEIHKMYDSGEIVKVKIPQKYKDVDEKAVLGTPVGGFWDVELCSYSFDEMAFMHVDLVLVEDQVYASLMRSGDIISGYPLPIEMNQYIIDSVFADL